MGQKIDAVGRGVSMIGKLMTSALWGGAAVLGFQSGQMIVGIVAVAYLGYLWLLGGRLLIY